MAKTSYFLAFQTQEHWLIYLQIQIASFFLY